jgi:hypothetical protein
MKAPYIAQVPSIPSQQRARCAESSLTGYPGRAEAVARNGSPGCVQRRSNTCCGEAKPAPAFTWCACSPASEPLSLWISSCLILCTSKHASLCQSGHVISRPQRERTCPAPSHRTRPGAAADGVMQFHSLAISAADIDHLPEVDFPPGHPVYHVASLTDLPSSSPSFTPLLFPPTATDIRTSSEAIVGFNVKWCAHLGRAETGATWQDSQCRPVSPATVVQLSSAHATVVVNLYALGVSMGESCSVTAACATALVAVKPIFADNAIVKAGLQCSADLSRLRQLCSDFQASNVVDCQV